MSNYKNVDTDTETDIDTDIEDIDPHETQEWLDALEAVHDLEGLSRVKFLLEKLTHKYQLTLTSLNTPYINTIHVNDEPKYPGDLLKEQKIRAYVRWNAMATVVRAQEYDSSLGGHIGSFASSAALYETGLNHFWRAANKNNLADLVYVQGHVAPGIYARSFLEGKFTAKQLDSFRREAGKPGLSSYPHPWLMPDFWQFPTVSMGLGPLQAIYQARFINYLEARGLIKDLAFEHAKKRKVWCMCGDAEMDEPEALGAIARAAEEKLDNLIFVVNCNLQGLDGPVRGNGKIIQDLENIFKGAGWNVLKVIWGGNWDSLLDKDENGALVQRMQQTLDGDYQSYKAKGGEYVRKHFFGVSEELLNLVQDLTDEDIRNLKRGGHDPQKLYAAFLRACEHQGRPTVILAKTVKGYGLGEAGEAKNTAHNAKKISAEQLITIKNRFSIQLSDKQAANADYVKLEPAEQAYLTQCREKLGGDFFKRRLKSGNKLKIPKLSDFNKLLTENDAREFSTTMAFVRILTVLLKDKEIGAKVVPIIPDEARTFGMEGLFRQIGIYSPRGQQYQPVDAEQVMYYKQDVKGQLLQEGINEAGAMCSWIAAATAYSTHDCTTIPFYIFYSMFGFQRTGDLAWAAGDMRAKGFLIGATSGRTTLNGEGLQHQDGHSHILANTIPNCITYDPSFAYELAVIIQHGLHRMYVANEDVYFYITTVNENYPQLNMPKGVEQGIIDGMYKLKTTAIKGSNKVQLLGAGAILQEVIHAAALLENYAVAADIWSVTSFNKLYRDGIKTQEQDLFGNTKAKASIVSQNLTEGPIIAATDYIKAYAEQIRPFLQHSYYVLGTDGFGCSDTRAELRKHFKVDRYHIAYTALHALYKDGLIKKEVLTKFKQEYPIKQRDFVLFV